MNIFQRMGLVLNKTSFQRYIESFYGGDDVPGGSESIDMMKYSAVFACVRVLSETFASVTINEYKRVNDGDREKTNDTGLLDILKNVPNGYMSAYNFHEMSMVQLNTDGNFYALKDKTRGNITNLRPIPSSEVETTLENGKIVYKVNLDGTEKTVTRDEIYHIVGFSANGITGLSPLEYFSAITEVGVTYQQFSNNFYKNGMFPTGFFEHERFLKDEAYNRLYKDLKSRYSGMKKTGTPFLLEDGLKFTPVTIKPIDAQLLESKRFQIEDICRVYRVPLHLVQNLDRATNNNIEHQSLEFVMYTMLPWFRRVEMAINTQLLTHQQRDAGYYFEFNMGSLLRGDSKSMAEAFATGRQWGWLSVNDIRRMLNMNSIPNGDIYLEPMNMGEAGAEPDTAMVNSIVKMINESKGR